MEYLGRPFIENERAKIAYQIVKMLEAEHLSFRRAMTTLDDAKDMLKGNQDSLETEIPFELSDMTLH